MHVVSDFNNLCQRISTYNWKDVYTAEDLSQSVQRKIDNACKVHGLGSSEIILVLIDNTILGSGKDSVVFTKQRFSVCKHKLLGKNEVQSIEWGTIKSFILVNGNLVVSRKNMFSEVVIPITDIIDIRKVNVEVFISELNSVLKIKNSEYENQSSIFTTPIGYLVMGALVVLVMGYFIYQSALGLNTFSERSSETDYDTIPTTLVDQSSLMYGLNSSMLNFAVPERDSVHLEGTFKNPKSILLYINESKRDILEFEKTHRLDTIIEVPETAVYTLKFASFDNVNDRFKVSRVPVNNHESQYSYTVRYDTIVHRDLDHSSATDYNFTFTKIFEDPHKATLNSAGKKNLTGYGENRVIIPFTLPSNTLAWFYRFNFRYREETPITSLNTDLNRAYTEELGTDKNMLAFDNSAMIPIGVLGEYLSPAELLFKVYDRLDQVPTEEAYLNYFLISDEAEAKRFLDGDNFDYEISSSQKNIQSVQQVERNIIQDQLFIALENTNLREQVYADIEIIAVQGEEVTIEYLPKINKQHRR